MWDVWKAGPKAVSSAAWWVFHSAEQRGVHSAERSVAGSVASWAEPRAGLWAVRKAAKTADCSAEKAAGLGRRL